MYGKRKSRVQHVPIDRCERTRQPPSLTLDKMCNEKTNAIHSVNCAYELFDEIIFDLELKTMRDVRMIKLERQTCIIYASRVNIAR